MPFYVTSHLLAVIGLLLSIWNCKYSSSLSVIYFYHLETCDFNRLSLSYCLSPIWKCLNSKSIVIRACSHWRHIYFPLFELFFWKCTDVRCVLHNYNTVAVALGVLLFEKHFIDLWPFSTWWLLFIHVWHNTIILQTIYNMHVVFYEFSTQE